MSKPNDPNKEPSVTTESPKGGSPSVDLRNWALNSIRAPTEVVDLIPDISLIPESFLSHRTFLEPDLNLLQQNGDDPDVLQGLADWLAATDLSYLKLKDPEMVYVPEHSSPFTPLNLPGIAIKVSNSCSQRFPFLNLQQSGLNLDPGVMDARDILAEALKPDVEYDMSEGFENLVPKLLHKEFLPDGSDSNQANSELEIRRSEISLNVAKERLVRLKSEKVPQTPKELHLSKLNKFLLMVFEYTEDVSLEKCGRGDLDLVFAHGETKYLKSKTIIKIEKLAIPVMENKTLDLLSEEVLSHLFRLLQSTVVCAESTCPLNFKSSVGITLASLNDECSMASLGIAGARLAVLMAKSLSDSKSLYNETLVTRSLSLVKHLIENSILPALGLLLEEKKDTKSELTEGLHALAPNLSKLALSISGFAQEFVGFLRINKLAFDSILSLVYTCLYALFSDLTPGTKASIFSPGASVNFKKQFQGVLQAVFVLYPDQRSTIVEEVVNSLTKLPAEKRSHKTFKLVDGKSIHIVTAIVLRLSQSCTEQAISKLLLPFPAHSHLQAENFSVFSESFPPVADRLISACRLGIDESNQVISPVLSFLLIQATKVGSTNGAEYRQILDTMLEDALFILNLPEWPAAEAFLNNLCARLCKIIDDPADSPSKALALDCLGLIAARIKKPKVESPDLRDKDLICALEQMPEQLSKDVSVLSLKSFWTCFERLARYLKALASIDDSYECARQWLLCDWGLYIGQAYTNMGNSDTQWGQDVQAYIKLCVSKVIQQSCDKGVLDSLLVTEQQTPANRDALFALNDAAAPRGRLYSCFMPILSRVILAMDSAMLTNRTRAVRALATILEASPESISMPRVLQSMRLRLQDTSAAVRSAAVDLVRRCIAAHPAMTQELYAIINDRVQDTSTSVRKGAIKVLIGMSHTAGPDTLKDICLKFLPRTIDSENTVRKYAIEGLQDIWFSPLQGQELPVGHDLQTKSGLDSLSALHRKQILDRATLIVEVITSIFDTPSGEDLVSRFISTSLYEPAQSDKSEKSEKSDKSDKPDAAKRRRKSCSFIGRLLIDCFFFQLVQFQRESDKASLHSTMQAITAFGSSGGLLMPPTSLATLEPFLAFSKDKRDQLSMCNALKIYNLTLPHIDHPNVSLLKRIESNLITNILKNPSAIVIESVPLICCMGSIINSRRLNVVKVYDTCRARIKQLRAVLMNNQLLNESEENLLGRLLLILGLVGQYIDTARPKSGASAAQEVILQKEDVDEIFETIFFFIDKVSSYVRTHALKGLGGLTITYPKLLLREEYRQALLTVLRSDDERIKSALLIFLDSYLKNEASQLSPEAASKKAEADDVRLAGNSENMSEASICSSIFQILLSDIIKCVLTDSFDIQVKGLNVIDLILKQGHVMPIECVPVLVAMQTEPKVLLQRHACEIYSKLESKYPGLIHTRNIEAIQCAYHYHLRRFPVVRGYQSFSDDCPPTALLHFLYKIIQSTSRRDELFASIIKFFDFGDPKSYQVELGFRRFLVENLATFDYKAPQEILSLFLKMSPIIVSGEVAIQHAEGTVPLPDGVTSKMALDKADSISLLISLKLFLSKQYGLINGRACKEKSLSRLGNNIEFPWETFVFSENSAARLRDLLNKDLGSYEFDINPLKKSHSTQKATRPAKRPKISKAKVEEELDLTCDSSDTDSDNESEN